MKTKTKWVSSTKRRAAREEVEGEDWLNVYYEYKTDNGDEDARDEWDIDGTTRESAVTRKPTSTPSSSSSRAAVAKRKRKTWSRLSRAATRKRRNFDYCCDDDYYD